MHHDDIYFVIHQQAIMLDEMGAPVIYDLNDDATINWDSEDVIDWLDLLPDEYQLYKAAVDFLQSHITSPMYIK